MYDVGTGMWFLMHGATAAVVVGIYYLIRAMKNAGRRYALERDAAVDVLRTDAERAVAHRLTPLQVKVFEQIANDEKSSAESRDEARRHLADHYSSEVGQRPD